ncbi:MAG: tetratricopeptide repeat protein [Myxococcota bacterium]
MTARRWLFAALACAILGGCDKDKEDSKSPGDDRLSVLEGLGNDVPAAPDPGSTEAPKAGETKAEDLPKVQDRDPEEEKRKMAESRQRSAQARKMLSQGKTSEAVTNARAALKIHEQNVDAMMVLGEVFYRQGKFELVVSVTTTALAVDEKARTPKDTSSVYNLQGFALASLGKDQMATQAFKKAAEADDQNAAAWNNLGTRYLRAGDVATAAACFEYALELRPSFAKAHLNYGAALRAQGKVAEAEAEIRKAMELRKNYAEAHFTLGVLYLDAETIGELSTTQRLQTAIDNLEKYKQLASGRTASEPLAKGLGTRKRIAPASSERADDYIRLARKGIEREQRRAKRKAESEADTAAEEAEAAAAAAAEQDAAAAEAGAGDATPEPATPTGGDGAPSAPQAPAKPGGSTQAPAKPGGPQNPSKPGAPQAPAKPGGSTQAPTKPGGSDPAPTKPQAPAKPGGGEQPPAKPGGSPTAPSDPAPTQPAKPAKPAKPQAPNGSQPTPDSPQKPAPQKPGVQRPGKKSASAWNPRGCADTNPSGAACFGADASAAEDDTRMAASIPFERVRRPWA